MIIEAFNILVNFYLFHRKFTQLLGNFRIRRQIPYLEYFQIPIHNHLQNNLLVRQYAFARESTNLWKHCWKLSFATTSKACCDDAFTSLDDTKRRTPPSH